MLKTLTTLCLALLLAPAAGAIDIEITHAPDADFVNYHTYGWKLVERPENHPLREGSPMDLYIRSVLEDELADEGLRLAEEGEDPDVLVSYDGVLVPELEDIGVHKDLGPITWVGVSNPSGTVSQARYVGHFQVVLEEPDSGRRLWTGRADGLAFAGQPEQKKLKKKLKKAIASILRRYPWG
jgi:hypothetical protein